MKSRRASRAERRLTGDVARHRLLDVEQFCRDRPQRSVAVKALDQRAQGGKVGILLIGVQRDAVIMRQRGQRRADPDQAIRIVRGIAVELELEIAGAGVFLLVGDTALAFDPVIHADRVPDRDALQPLAAREKPREIFIVEIARQTRIDAGYIIGHAVKEVDAGTAQQRIEDRLVDFGRPVGRRQRRNVFAGAGLDLRADTGCVEAERRLEAGMRQIDISRDQQRASQFRHGLFRRQMRPLVEPFCNQKLGASARRPPLAFDLDLDPHKSLRRRVDDDRAEPERPGKVTGRSKKAMSFTAKR